MILLGLINFNTELFIIIMNQFNYDLCHIIFTHVTHKVHPPAECKNVIKFYVMF